MGTNLCRVGIHAYVPRTKNMPADTADEHKPPALLGDSQEIKNARADGGRYERSSAYLIATSGGACREGRIIMLLPCRICLGVYFRASMRRPFLVRLVQPSLLTALAAHEPNEKQAVLSSLVAAQSSIGQPNLYISVVPCSKYILRIRFFQAFRVLFVSGEYQCMNL